MFGKKINSLVLISMMAALKTVAAGDVVASDGVQGKPTLKTKGPLKIYLMAGQSNMQGQSRVSTVPRMALSPESKALHDKILDENGKPRIHQNVYIAAFSQDGGYGVKPTDQEKHGPLTVGYGNNLKSDGILGPELGFGITMGELVGEPILIIKTSWGGKSLNYNFRPPSAGKPSPSFTEEEIAKMKAEYPGQLAAYEKTKRGKPPVTVEEQIRQREETNKDAGKYYRLMMAHVKTVLADPGKYCPAYDPKQGYEIAGFAWFQGYNDMIAGNSELYLAKGDRPSYAAYSDLLAQLIRDVRKELNTPNMPVVIGVMGIDGKSTTNPGMIAFRKAMAAPAEMPEFKGTVTAIATADFWDDEMGIATKKVKDAESMWDDSAYWTPVGEPKPEDRIWHYFSFNLDEKEQYRSLEEGEKGDERVLTQIVPEEMKGWLEPGFDTSKWQKGPAPIGKGDVKQKKGEPEKKAYRSPWGDGNMLVMKTSFALKSNDFVKYRLRVKSTGSYCIYLNGHIIRNYPWWKSDGFRMFDLTEEQVKLVKQGENVLAFYGNMGNPKSRAFNSVDFTLEGITKEQLDDITKKQAEVCTPRDIALSKGQSNQSFHYMGSAYTYSLIGEAFAKALAEMGKKKD
jgi:Carbohydrate esterase, sialic acid-specific acetylesterase